MSYLLIMLLSSTLAKATPSAWEAVHTVERADAELATIVVGDDGFWIAAGGDVIVRGGPREVQIATFPGKFIVGLGGGGADPVVAVGGDDLILSWDGKSWRQESFDPDATKLSRMRRRGLVLQGAVRPPGQPFVAYGPWRVLVRRADGKWQAPDEAERYRLMLLAQLGPSGSLPKGCHLLQGRWLAGDQGWLNCHDRRTFMVVEKGRFVERGRLPGPCADALGTVVQGGHAIFATCRQGEVWRSEGTHWERVSAPQLDAIAVGGQCLYGVRGRVVWRNCSILEPLPSRPN